MNDENEVVILVDSQDQEVGQFAKIEAHKQGLLHRAISVCVVDPQGRMLLQRRARDKYHSGGLWTNACCTHPRPGESVAEAAERRQREELGVTCELDWVLSTHYQAPVSDGLIENEVVHLFHGLYNGNVTPDAREVDSFVWTSRETLLLDIEKRPQDFTYWFRYYIRSFADRLFLGVAA